ncbi:MAG: glutamyl-tRNA reductase [SAR324 cluster bacterium]|uniref:Glutamyl-tRNA reductase n=1 Tax=SAR324 cluster bacterium TaxID=2024889 RepID=A0A2A4T4C4_9DELT|nr:MAG: glutamyl-tRNA reductase [SAR324 cluster bacterium]
MFSISEIQVMRISVTRAIKEIMKLGILTASYKTVAIEVREKLAVPEKDVAPLIAYLKSECQVEEMMVVSTCNRVELYFHALNPLQQAEKVEQAFLCFIKQENLNFKFQRVFGREAIKHIFRVVSSLESMVIGESQIAGQIKNFFHLSVEGGGCGFLLNQVMNRAFLTSKRVRHETAIARFAVSISFAAVELAKKIFDEMSDKVILVIGAGEMAELAIGHLLKAGCSQLLVTNRTFSRAVSLAEKFNGSAVRFEQMESHLEMADIVISSTGAKGFILEPKMIKKSMKRRKHRSVFLIDIAVPRDIDPAINKVSNAYVYDIDDLQTVVDSNLKARQREAGHAEDIIEEELDKVEDWLAVLDVVPTIRSFREKVLDLANVELQKGMSQMGDLTAKQERAVRSMMNGFAYKLLHEPTVMIKQKAKEGMISSEYLQVMNDLFDLKKQEEVQQSSKVVRIK